MINDVGPPGKRLRRKTKRIEPLEKPMALPLVEQARAADPSFQTPEEVAASEPETIEPIAVHHHSPNDAPKQKWWRIQMGWPRTRKQQILSGVLVVLVAIGIGAGWTLTHQKRVITASGVPTKVKKVVPPKIIYSTLSGLPITDASLNSKPVTAVMVENSLDARPQSGLSEAGVVFEAVAEGGVTRFMALFQDTTPTNVGPIRSARPYYVSWALGFDAAYAHVGGSDAALADISSWGVHDMNQFSNGSYYHRTTDRAAPHNVYTGIDTLNKLEAAKGYTSTFTGFPRKTEQPYKAPAAAAPATTKTPAKPAAPADTRTPATSIGFALSGPTYDPHYDYNATTNSYNRGEAGVPQTDANTGKQLSPKVIIAIVVPLARGALDSSGAYYSDYTTIGSGQAFIFQDGTVTTGQWAKTSNNAQITFTDAAGKAILLNPGQSWISAVSAATAVTYK